MKHLLISLMIVALAIPAFAGTNPDVALFLTTDATGATAVNTHDPGDFYVYVCFDGFGAGGGMLGAAFTLSKTFSGYQLEANNLLGGLAVGSPDAGWAIATAGDCAMPVGGVVVAASLHYLATGVGTITVLPHPTDGAAVADCNNDLDFFCVHSVEANGVSGNFGVGMDAPNGDCLPNPVEDSSWGSIKALYR